MDKHSIVYTTFFNLKEKPFNLTPSPRFLYLGESHKEALALLTYGVVDRKGFILLTGEVGTGKTTMVQVLLENLRENVQTVYLSNPLISPKDLMDYLAFRALRQRIRFKSKAEFLVIFEDHLKQCLRDQRTFVLLIDEAQKLSFDLLEEIRLLSNLETAEEKMINIFLIGQPELNEKLSDPRCRPLLQRISIRHHISPLDLQGTKEYIERRLKVAGSSEPSRIIPKKAVQSIHTCSQGYPRMINVLADNALLLAYSRGIRTITPAMVRECYDDLKLEDSFFKRNRVGARREIKGSSDDMEEKAKDRRIIRLALGLVLAGLLLGFGISERGRNLLFRLGDFIPEKVLFSYAGKMRPSIEKSEGIEGKENDGGNAALENREEAKKQDVSLQGPPVSDSSDEALTEVLPVEMPEKAENSVPVHPRATQQEAGPDPVVVKEGDTLTGLALKAYGRVDERILDMIKENNPGIASVDLIVVGQRIVFPPASDEYRGPTFTNHVASFKHFEGAQILFQKLISEGYETYIIPALVPGQGHVFRVTVGSFDSREESNAYSRELLGKGVTQHAETIKLQER